MGSDAEAEAFLARYGLPDVARVSDPERVLYRAFELKRGSIAQVLGLSVIWRGIQAVLFEGHGLGRLVGDGWQMPGVFLVDKGQIVRSFRHRSIADRPVYEYLARRW